VTTKTSITKITTKTTTMSLFGLVFSQGFTLLDSRAEMTTSTTTTTTSTTTTTTSSGRDDNAIELWISLFPL